MLARSKADTIKHMVYSEDLDKFKQLGWEPVSCRQTGWPHDAGGYEVWETYTIYEMIWSSKKPPVYPERFTE